MKLPNKKNYYLISLIFSLIFATGIFIIFFLLPNNCKPIKNNGKKWRIGYYEGGPWVDYPRYLLALVTGLERAGWIDSVDVELEESSEDSYLIWQQLVQNVDSEYIEFVEEAYWSADWDEITREENKQDVISYVHEQKLDLIIAGGTWAGLDLANNQHSTPTIVISTSDPIQAGIIESAEDSGYDHIHALVDPERYTRQIHSFYNIVGFGKIGVVYEDTEESKIYNNVYELEKASEDHDFEVVPCFASEYDNPRDDVFACYQKLAPLVDAFWIGAHSGSSSEYMPTILEPLFDNKIPTWSQEGSVAVKNGVMLSVSEGNLEPTGDFYAHTIAQIFHGKKPRDINQVFEDPQEIIINKKVADMIGFELSDTLIDIADEVYYEIEGYALDN